MTEIIEVLRYQVKRLEDENQSLRDQLDICQQRQLKGWRRTGVGVTYVGEDD